MFCRKFIFYDDNKNTIMQYQLYYMMKFFNLLYQILDSDRQHHTVFACTKSSHNMFDLESQVESFTLCIGVKQFFKTNH